MEFLNRIKKKYSQGSQFYNLNIIFLSSHIYNFFLLFITYYDTFYDANRNLKIIKYFDDVIW